MFEKKIKTEDLEEFKKREELIKDFTLVVEALELQRKIRLRNLLIKYKMDLNKNYSIDLNKGHIKEIKKQPKK